MKLQLNDEGLEAREHGQLVCEPRTLVPCSRAKVSQLIRRVVKLSQPGVYARAHDLRKFATVQAFFSNTSMAQIRASGFWHSNFTIASRYLPLNVGPAQPCVAMGRVTVPRGSETL